LADKIVIEGIEAYDGEYDFDATYFTNRELHTIKRLSGIRAGELDDALGAGDNDVIVAMTVIALQRNGKFIDEDLIWNAEAGRISYRPDPAQAEAADAIPPASGTDESSAPAESSASSGLNGSNGSGNSQTTLPATGPESSVPSATSALPT